MIHTLLIVSIIIISLLLLVALINPTSKHFTTNNNNNKDDVYYIENFLNDTEFKTVRRICSAISDTDIKDEWFRKIRPLKDENIDSIFYSNDCINRISNIVGNNAIYKSNFPIEYRIYPHKSPGMKCHKDTLLYDKPQYEVVYTIDNDSDSYTTWYDYHGNKHNIYTKPNSLLIVKADGNLHCVSELNKGTRSILKLIYTQSDNINNKYKSEVNRFNF